MITSQHYQFGTLADGVWAAIATNNGGSFANSGIVDLGDSLLVFDTAVSPQAGRALFDAAMALSSHPGIDYAVNSHYHRDHIRGNAALMQNTTIISSRQTRDLMRTQGRRDLAADSENLREGILRAEQLLLHRGDGLSEHERQDLVFMSSWRRAMLESIHRLKLRLPDVCFDHRLTLYGTRRRVDLLEYRNAHTASDIILVLPDDGIAFLGDLLYIGRHAYVGQLDPAAYSAAVERIKGLGVTHLVAGHGPVGNLQDLAQMQRYVDTVHQLVADAIDNGADEDDVRGLAIPEPYRHWRFGMMLWEANLEALYRYYAGVTVVAAEEEHSA